MSLLLFIISFLVYILSSSVLYFYVYQKFMKFCEIQRSKRHISINTGGICWGYWSHVCALCIVVLRALVEGPLLYDYTVVYRGCLDGATLTAVLATIAHILFWVVIWLILTIRQSWRFHIRLIVGRTHVWNPQTVHLVNEIQVRNQLNAKHRNQAQNNPLLVIGNGRVYTVHDVTPKKAILGVVQQTLLGDKQQLDGEQLYWMGGKGSNKPSPTGEQAGCSGTSAVKKTASPAPKHKVTFEDTAGPQSPR